MTQRYLLLKFFFLHAQKIGFRLNFSQKSFVLNTLRHKVTQQHLYQRYFCPRGLSNCAAIEFNKIFILRIINYYNYGKFSFMTKDQQFENF